MKVIFDAPADNKHKLEKLWAILSVDKLGNEGVVATQINNVVHPMITGDYDLLIKMKATMQDIVDQAPPEITFKLVTFVKGEDLEVLRPTGATVS